MRTPFKAVVCAALCLSPTLAASPGNEFGARPFIDPIFPVARTVGLTYGSAPTAAPRERFQLLLDLYEPVGLPNAVQRPAILLLHGGGFVGGTRAHPGIVQLATEFASRGYVVASIDYRLSGQHPIISEEFGAFHQAMSAANSFNYPTAITAAVEDAHAAHGWLVEHQSRYNIDPHRISVGGGSAGAITALYLAYSIAEHGVPNHTRLTSVLSLWGAMGPFHGDLGPHDPPPMLVHGTADLVIPFSQSEKIARRARSVGVAHALHGVEGAGHGFGNVDLYGYEVEPGVTVFDSMVEFCFTRNDLAALAQRL